jgi:hypothetical protein
MGTAWIYMRLPWCEGEANATESSVPAQSGIMPHSISSSSADSTPELAMDGSLDTAWKVTGDGVNEYILLEFDQQVTVQDIEMVPGFDKTNPETGESLFTQYPRVKSVRLEFSDGSTVEAELASFAAFESLLRNPVTTSSVKIIIRETTASDATNPHNILAVSEIKVVGEE